MPAKINAEVAPHSWAIVSWPTSVYPNTAERARYFVRVHRRELFAAGALTRPGRELVVIGSRFVRWLESKAANVGEFDNGAARTRSLEAGRGRGAP
jgi:hypothetical protein